MSLAFSMVFPTGSSSLIISAIADYPGCILILCMLTSNVLGCPFIDMKVKALTGYILFIIVVDYSTAMEPIPQIN
jgi:hypothetical protein